MNKQVGVKAAIVALDGGASTQSSRCVLLADDDDALRETMKLWLPGDQWNVLEAANGCEALEQLDDSVDVLVLDRNMPELSGPEVVEQLHKTSFRGTVVVVTAYEPDTHLDETDVEKYITKPIERDQFVSELQRTVQ